MVFVIIFVVLIIVIFLVAFIAGIVGAASRKGKIKLFQKYLAANFPQIPPDEQLLTADQISQKTDPTVGLTLDHAKQQFILLFQTGRMPVTHKTYPFSSLCGVNRGYQIINRPTSGTSSLFSYEETLVLSFRDGTSYPFIAENISNRLGNDKGADVIRNFFNPWEQKLRGMIHPPPPPPPVN